MRIIIIGLGKVGYTLAENLSAEKHDVTLIELREEVLQRASDTLDVMCVRGNGASIQLLRSAGVDHTDVVIATTGRDELNMLCCLTAKRLGATYTIARIRDVDYAREQNLLRSEMDIDMVVNPEMSTAAQISRLLRFPNAADIETFYRGRIELVGMRINGDIPLINTPLSAIRKRLGNLPILFCALDRNGEVLIPNGSTEFQNGDNVFVIGRSESITSFFKAIGRNSQRIKDAFIVGGGRIGMYLARSLTAMNMNVKIVESDPKKCVELCEMLPKALIINGDGTDQELLISENVGRAGAFIALTGRDEDNLITATYAKQLGAKKVIAKINRQNFYDIINTLQIDSVISPKLITAYSILRTIRALQNSRGSRMEAMYRIAGEKAEAMEFTVSSATQYLDVPLKELNQKLKPGILIAVIVRDHNFIIPEGSDSIQINDNVIIISSGNQIHDLNDIFLA